MIDDLHSSYDYIINPEDMVEGIVDDITRDVKDKIRPRLEKKVYKVAMSKLGLEDD